MRYIGAIILVLLISGCSFKTPKNQWQHDANAAAKSFTQNFLQDKQVVAKNDYKRAISHAKQSANIETLARIKLTKCALLQMVSTTTLECKEFSQMKHLIDSKELLAYHAFLQKSLTKEQVQYLQPRYRSFAHAMIAKDSKSATTYALQMKSVQSLFLSTAMVAPKLSAKEIDAIIEKASYYGYKKIATFWLRQKVLRFNDIQALELLQIIEE